MEERKSQRIKELEEKDQMSNQMTSKHKTKIYK